MSKSAAYSALGQGLMFGAQQLQHHQNETARERRERALAELKSQYRVGEITYEDRLKRDRAEEEWRREEPKRNVELDSERALAEQRRASAEAARARAEAYGDEGGGQNLTANQRDALALAKAKGIPEGQAWDYVMQSGRQPPERIVSGIASDLLRANDGFDNPYSENPEQAYEDAREIYEGLRSAYQSEGNGGLMGRQGASGGNQGGSGGLMDQAGGEGERSPYPDGTRLRGPDGKIYVVRDGQPVLEQ